MTTEASSSPTPAPLPAKAGVRWRGLVYAFVGFIPLALARKYLLEPAIGRAPSRFLYSMACWLLLVAFALPSEWAQQKRRPRLGEVTAALLISVLLASLSAWIDTL